jgi:hypothetical protein
VGRGRRKVGRKPVRAGGEGEEGGREQEEDNKGGRQ